MTIHGERPAASPFYGLTQADVLARRAANQGNNVRLQTSRSYWQIVRENLFTFINLTFFSISLVMLLLGRVGDAFLVVVVIFGGVLVNIYQESWAKRTLDRIALLNRPQATVIREGQEVTIDPSEIVLGDLIQIQAGDQLLVDGEIVGEGRIEVDESLLTGESDQIPKQAGDRVYSGTACVSGSACYEAQQVGKATVAYRLMDQARAFRHALTPLQQEINVVIRVFVLIAVFLWILVGISFLSRDYSLNELVQRAAVIAGLVPAGLLLAITLAYGLGAVRMVGQDVLIQQANAVESLSNINILCLDKTGTLTTNHLTLHGWYPIDRSEAELRSLLGLYAASVTTANRTIDAIAHACPAAPHPITLEVPFSSARKWSAIALSPTPASAAPPPGLYLLGAPEILVPASALTTDERHWIDESTHQGLRVLLFAWSPDLPESPDSPPTLPTRIKPLGIVRFQDELRPEAKETLANFAQAGIQIKIISGDNPQTVTAVAQQVGLRDDEPMISGSALAELDQLQFNQAAVNHTIFGRITPDQKAQLVRSLRRSGHYVAMIGDGVNDILSLKQANLAIAMESGSKATRGVADIVLLNDAFGTLPKAFLEGQRIRNGIQDVLKLFMVRTLCVTLLIFATAIVSDSFPLANKQSAVVTLIGVGFPSMVIPVWAKPGTIPQRSLVRSMLHFVLPAAMTLTLVALLVYLFYLVYAILDLPPGSGLAEVNYAIPRSALVCILIWGELLLIPFLKPPTTAWVGGEPLSRDWRYSLVALTLFGIYSVMLMIAPVRAFFELVPLSLSNYIFIGLIALQWCLILRLVWRTRSLDRFLGVDLT